MKNVRAKFKCISTTTHDSGSITVNMQPVMHGSEENKSFNDYTPSGKLEISISKDKPAQLMFTAGKEYYIDFTLAE